MSKLSLNEATTQYSYLANKFTTSITERTFDTFEDLFTDDCDWSVGPPLKFHAVGAKEIRSLISGKLADIDLMFQLVGSSYVTDIHDDRILGTSTIIEIGRINETTAFEVLGSYADEIVNDNGVWKFSRRKFRVIGIDNSPVAYKLYQTLAVD